MAFRNSAIAVGTSLTTLYTCPPGYECVVHSLYVSNLDPINTITIDIQVAPNMAGQVARYAAKNITIPAGTSLIFDKPITLRASDTVKIAASAALSAEAFGSFLLTAEDASAPN